MIKAFRDSDLGYSPYGEKIGVREVGRPGLFKALGAVFTSFQMFAGKGSSRYDFYVGSDDFEELAGKMIEANPDAAIRAFGATLQKYDDPVIKALGVVLSGLRKSAPAVGSSIPAVVSAPLPPLPPRSLPLPPLPPKPVVSFRVEERVQ